MLKYSQLKTIFSNVDFPIEEYVIKVDDTIDLPYGVYICANNNVNYADGKNLVSILTVRLLLMDDSLNFDNQYEIEEVLNENEVGFTKDYDYNEELGIYMVNYQFEVLEDERELDSSL